MSSLRNAVKRKTHKERGQLSHRKKLGLLEKKKDYKQRATDFQKKRTRLQQLHQKAAFRNPDEFYFRMVNTKTKNGVHQVDRSNESGDAAVTNLIRSQNIGYLKTYDGIESSKIERMRSSLHFIDTDPVNTHTVFLSDDEEAENFDKAEYFETTEEFADRTFNRPTVETLKSDNLLLSGDSKDLKKAIKSRERSYQELEQRLDRQDKLRRALGHMETYKKLEGKGRRFKTKDAERGKPAQYKWKQERKR